MADHNSEDSVSAQLAILVAVKLLLSQFQGNAAAATILESELERMRASLLASPAEERKLLAFDQAAQSLIEAGRPIL